MLEPGVVPGLPPRPVRPSRASRAPAPRRPCASPSSMSSVALREYPRPTARRDDGRDHVGPCVDARFEAADAVDVERCRDEAVGHGQSQRGDRDELVKEPGSGLLPCKWRARLRDEGDDPHLLRGPFAGHRRDAQRWSASLPPAPSSMPSSTSRPHRPRGGAGPPRAGRRTAPCAARPKTAPACSTPDSRHTSRPRPRAGRPGTVPGHHTRRDHDRQPPPVACFTAATTSMSGFRTRRGRSTAGLRPSSGRSGGRRRRRGRRPALTTSSRLLR